MSRTCSRACASSRTRAIVWPDFGCCSSCPASLALVRRLSGRMPGWPAELAAVRIWYDPHLERIHEDAALRGADLIQLEQIAMGYGSRQQFLTELTLDPPDATSALAGAPLLDEDYLVLSTIHS